MILHHVSVGVSDVARAGRFYDAVLATLGYKRFWEIMPYAICYGEDGYDFWVQIPSNGQPASAGNGVHIAFTATTRKAVDRFYETALAHGASDEGPPGLRPEYDADYYAAFVRDPDGNKLEALCYGVKTAAKPKAKKAPAKKAAKAPAKKAKKKARKK
ncbi:MAG: VOC family protein [Alphaproteobacteria bacterium]|nr:VOC family protein [Alphaproteobacteria bacterium]MDE2073265.1 VOC family protein [Alphaproteobacteria bacterium]MDE2351227.1 VOC family protein [Alphaproteobacteria bacterium]